MITNLIDECNKNLQLKIDGSNSNLQSKIDESNRIFQLKYDELFERIEKLNIKIYNNNK